MALGQVCGGQNGNGTGLWWSKLQWDRFVVVKVALQQVCGGQSGTATGFWRSKLHWDRFVVVKMAMGQVCGGQSCSGTGLWRSKWHLDRFVAVKVAVGQVYLPVLRFFSVSIIPPMLHAHLYLHFVFTTGTNVRSLEPPKKPKLSSSLQDSVSLLL